MKIQLSIIHESPNKLREVVKDASFSELLDSLQQQGLLQPIKVRPNNDGYELIYGHRRFTAMRQLGWTECEAIVEQVDEDTALAQSIMENLHRADMTALEESNIYKALLERGVIVSAISRMIGKSDTYVRSRLSLLSLPAEVQAMIAPKQSFGVVSSEQGVLPIDSARTIMSSTKTPDETIQVAQKVVEEKLTLMEVREFSRQLKQADTPEQRQILIEKPFKVESPTQNGFSSKPFHTANRSVGDQFHSKILWNLKRIDLKAYAHFTVGYSQRNWSQVAELLQIAHVTVLIDARRNAVSQYKPEFSKSNLQTVCDKAGIKYSHVPELGIGSEDREDLAINHDYQALFDTYTQRLSDKMLAALLGQSLKNERLAFLCVELDPETCHRHRIALTIEEMGYKTLDL